ncbi:ATPase [Sphingomonas sp. LHG3406-1]|uniref:F0F1 ATP synthase subunit B family protein n=1 Tax=Sphingomonas sp. LHG3406-1 TaxID=2804617 RepID=UPI002626C259|nr:ATPase [Sphingomonas sp. LHG3406-1]
MPQIAQIAEIFASQLFWLTITFGLIFLVVGLGMVPKIQGTVDLRDQRIASDLATAASARETADRLEAEHRTALEKSRAEAAKVAAEAKAASAQASEARVKAADAAAQTRVDEAMRRIAEARVSAEAEIEAVAADAAAAMVSRVAGLSIDEGSARAAVKQELVRG